MRTMDEGQLQKLLNAAAASTAAQNPMMLFSPMANLPTPTTPATTSSATIATSPLGQMAWPLKNPLMATPNSLEMNIATLLYLQQALHQQNQAQGQVQHAAALPPPPPVTSVAVSPIITTPTISLPNYPFFTPTIVQSATPSTTSSTNTPTPPEVLSTLSSMIHLQQQQQQQQQKSATPPIVESRKISSVSLPAEFVPIASSGSSSLSASSPSTSSKKEEEEEEDGEEEFVDVESVEVAIDTKEKRKAHVEFYRRMKTMRQQDKALTCGSCRKKIDNQENAIAVHVAEHADAGGYQCRLCGWQSIDKYKIYSHMRLEHPRKVEMFVDKRDMPKMCLILSQCFPKTTCRPKKESNQNADTYIAMVLKSGKGETSCELCKGRVRLDKAAMIRHVQSNHTIKCKTCKTISDSLDEQLAHQEESHQQKCPKMSVHYAPSAAAIYLLPALEKCFPIGK